MSTDQQTKKKNKKINKGTGGLFLNAPVHFSTEDSHESLAFAPDLLANENTDYDFYLAESSEFDRLTSTKNNDPTLIKSAAPTSLKYPKATEFINELLHQRGINLKAKQKNEVESPKESPEKRLKSNKNIISTKESLKDLNFPAHEELQQFVLQQRQKPNQLKPSLAPQKRKVSTASENPYLKNTTDSSSENAVAEDGKGFKQQNQLQDMVEMVLVGADNDQGHEIHLLFKDSVLNGLQLRLQQQADGLFAHFIVNDNNEKRRILGEIDHLVIQLKDKGLKVSGYRIEVRH